MSKTQFVRGRLFVVCWILIDRIQNLISQSKFGIRYTKSEEICIERCPPEALAMGDNDVPQVNLDRCFGCAVCATGCPSDAIVMEAKPDFPAPPKELITSLKASFAKQAR